MNILNKMLGKLLGKDALSVRQSYINAGMTDRQYFEQRLAYYTSINDFESAEQVKRLLSGK